MSTAAPLPEPVTDHNLPLPTLEQLPDDPETLKRMVRELLSTLQEERRDKEDLQHRLNLLLRRLYGPRSERLNPDQLVLFGEDAQAPGQTEQPAANSPPQPASPQRRHRPHGRRLLPENLRRELVHHELTAAERLCVCGQMRIDIGNDVSEQLDWRPASFFVLQHVIHKYACPSCSRRAAEMPPQTDEQAPADTAEQVAAGSSAAARAEALPVSPDAGAGALGPAVVSALKPASPIAKGLPGPGLLAQVIVSKYVDHLPLYRQEQIFERQGVFLARSTTCDWLAACAELLRPLYARLVALVLQSKWLHTDDTPVKNLGHAPDQTATGRFWGYLGDRDHPGNVFDFTVNRKRDGPQTFLADFHGYLHADAFSGYDALYLPSPQAGTAAIVEVACNAHARRKFYEARGSDAMRAHQALAYYGQLYEIERRANDNDFTDEQRLQARRDLAVPILDQFRAWLEEQRQKVLPKSSMAEAIGYALNNWTALKRYTEAGYLAIDNNVAEREMKRIAIGRKNWLFVGSDNGGRTAAVLFSFTSTCHRLGIDPWAYLHDVLARLPALPAENLDELLPHRWQAARQRIATASKESAAAQATSEETS